MNQETKETVREEILNAASIAFNKFGYKKTTLDDIAIILNRGKSGIYYYFKNKDEVFQAVVIKESENFKEKIRNKLQSINSLSESIEVYVKTRMTTFIDLGNFYGTLKTDAFDHLQFINFNRKIFDNAEIEVLLEMFEKYNEKQQVSICQTNKLAQTLVNMLKGFESQFFNNTNISASYNEQIDILVDVLCNGIVRK